MQPALSVYLDALRLVAALWVAATHLRSWDLASAELMFLPIRGHDAVVIFFVLSGYVVTHAATSKRSTLPDFVLDRAARIYSVVLPVLALCLAIDLIGSAIAPTSYRDHYELKKLWLYVPIYLAFVGQNWALVEVPTSLIQFWSLYYEVWYYALFAIAWFYSGRKRVVMIVLVALIVGPRQWLLFPTWLLGCLAYRYGDRLRLAPIAARLVVATTLLAYVLLRWLELDRPLLGLSESFIVHTFHLRAADARWFLEDYVTASLVALNIAAFRRADFRAPDGIGRAIRWAAGYSFTLYLMHGVVFNAMIKLGAARTPSLAMSLAIIALTLAASVVVGHYTERRKHVFRALLASLLEQLDRSLRNFPGLRRAVLP
jgi:peptidoglycan/LPS O-acetylase OafA/YrhL